MLSMESSMGRTKQARSCCTGGVPAFIRVDCWEKKACFHETQENVSQSVVYFSIFFSSNIRGYSFPASRASPRRYFLFVTAEIAVSRHLQGIFWRTAASRPSANRFISSRVIFPFRPPIYQPGHFYKFMRYCFHTTLPLFINREFLPLPQILGKIFQIWSA